MRKAKKVIFRFGGFRKSPKKRTKKGPPKSTIFPGPPKNPKKGGVQKRVIFQDSGAIFWPQCGNSSSEKVGGLPHFSEYTKEGGGGSKKALFWTPFWTPLFWGFWGSFLGSFFGPFWDLLDFLGSGQPIKKLLRGFVIERQPNDSCLCFFLGLLPRPQNHDLPVVDFGTRSPKHPYKNQTALFFFLSRWIIIIVLRDPGLRGAMWGQSKGQAKEPIGGIFLPNTKTSFWVWGLGFMANRGFCFCMAMHEISTPC